MKKLIFVLVSCMLLLNQFTVYAQPETDAKSVILIEQSGGKVLYENNPDEKLPIASVTKIMTMLLIMEAIDEGRITLDDMVSVSENAMSYGGSTMFLEAGESLSVSDMLKGIAVASANDGCVAMAEHLEGSESEFVEKMNEKAKELGMQNTNFINTNGLDADGHYSSARDVAIMSRELLKHEKIFDYTKIWVDSLRDGKFQLANTNKLIRFYAGANGLKTGSTSKALCCISASAIRDDMQLIAVVLGAPTSDKRFSSAKALLDYGFANYKKESVCIKDEGIGSINVAKGVLDSVEYCADDDFSVIKEKSSKQETKCSIDIPELLYAPIRKGDKVGEMKISVGDDEHIIPLVASADVNKKSVNMFFDDYLDTLLGNN